MAWWRCSWILICLLSATVAVCLGDKPPDKVKRVEFSGNRHLTNDELQPLIRGRDFASSERLEAALDRIERAYLDAGFARVDIDGPFLEEREERVRDHIPRPFASKLKRIILARVSIQEGDRYRFGRIETPELKGLGELGAPKPDSFYSEAAIEGFARLAQLRLFENGQLPARLEVKREIDDRKRQVNLRLEVEILPALEIRRIEFLGHRVYPDRFYRRELAIQEGELLDPRPIAESIERLSKTGALASIDGGDFEIRPDLGREEADVVIHLREKKRQRILFSGEPGGGAELSLLYSVANLLGLGEKLGLDLTVGSSGSEAAIQLASKYFLGSSMPVQLGLRIFHRHTSLKLPGVEDQLFRLLGRSSSGIQSLVGLRVTPRQTAALSTELTWLRTSNQTRVALTPSWELGDRESRGNRVRVSHRFSFLPQGTRVLRKDLTFSRSWDAVPVDAGGTGFRFHFAHAEAVGSRSVPLFERILPEQLEVRGFSVTSGPWRENNGDPAPAGSEFLATLAVQYRFPVHEHLTVVPFVDAGVSATPGSIESTNRILRTSLGTEFRLRLSPKLPPPRLVLAWNPLRLDSLVETARGTARLRDPRVAFRVGW